MGQYMNVRQRKFLVVQESDILYQAGPFWVCRENYGKVLGYAVYQDGVTHSTRVARIGFPGPPGLRRAIDEADRRNDAEEPLI